MLVKEWLKAQVLSPWVNITELTCNMNDESIPLYAVTP